MFYQEAISWHAIEIILELTCFNYEMLSSLIILYCLSSIPRKAGALKYSFINIPKLLPEGEHSNCASAIYSFLSILRNNCLWQLHVEQPKVALCGTSLSAEGIFTQRVNTRGAPSVLCATHPRSTVG